MSGAPEHSAAASGRDTPQRHEDGERVAKQARPGRGQPSPSSARGLFTSRVAHARANSQLPGMAAILALVDELEAARVVQGARIKREALRKLAGKHGMRLGRGEIGNPIEIAARI